MSTINNTSTAVDGNGNAATAHLTPQVVIAKKRANKEPHTAAEM